MSHSECATDYFNEYSVQHTKYVFGVSHTQISFIIMKAFDLWCALRDRLGRPLLLSPASLTSLQVCSLVAASDTDPHITPATGLSLSVGSQFGLK